MTRTNKAKAKAALKKIEALAEQRGLEGTVGTADKFYNPFDLRRPSGITSLDMATGGGLPAGGLSQIDGEEGIGKNFLMFLYMMMCQLIYGDEAAIGMACFENLIDKPFARNVGVQIAFSDYEIELEQRRRKKIGSPRLTKKQITELQTQLGVFAIARGDNNNVLRNILQLVGSNAYQIIGVDSWDATLPPKEEQKNIGDKPRVAAAAGLQTQFMNRLHALLHKKVDGKENETTIIGIRQVRANMSGAMFDVPFKAQGAHSLRHGKLVDVTLSRGKAIKDSKKVKIGKYIYWAITKGKAGCHDGPRGEYAYYYEPPRADTVEDLWGIAEAYGVVAKRKDKYEFRVQSLQDMRGSKEGIMAIMREDEETRMKIRNALIEIRQLNIRYQ